MSVNKSRPYVWVLPEDDAARQMAVGFERQVYHRQLQVLPEVGGWPRMRDELEAVYYKKLEKNLNAHLVLLFDFDGKADRPEKIMGGPPTSVKQRIFFLGPWSEPEKLRGELKLSLEAIGCQVADDCRGETWSEMWQCSLLKHNLEELERAASVLRGILFP